MPLFTWFVVRRLREESFRTALTIGGVALGVAVVLAIQLANHSALGGFRAAMDAVAGRTSLEIVGSGVGVSEAQLAALGWLREWGDVSPVIEGDALALFGGDRGEAVRVLGVDILQDQPFRDYRLLRSQGAGANAAARPSVREFLDLLVDPSSIIVAEGFARRHAVSVGGRLDISMGDQLKTFTVRGVLGGEGPARVLDGNFVLMDIAAAQWAFDRLGRVDRVDVLLADPSRLDQAEEAIAARLPVGLAVQRPARRGAQVEQMLAAFQFNLAALSWVAVIVGLFLVYNTLATAVIARRSEIGILRAVGATRQTVLALFLGEAALLGAVGCLAGIPLGRLLAWGAVHFTSATVTTLYVADAAAVPSLSTAQAVGAFVIGVPLAILSALGPAREASRVAPIAAIRSAARDVTTPRGYWKTLSGALGCFAAAVWASRQPPLGGLPVLGLIASVLVVFGVALLIPAVLGSLALAAGRGASVMGLATRLATANLAAAVRRLSVSVAALTVSLAMLVAVAVMIGSFRETVIYWVGQTLQADLFVATGRRASLDAQPTISASLEQTIENDADVASVERFTALTVPYGGRLILLGAADFRRLESRTALVFAAPSGRSVLSAAAGNGEVIVSESFSRRFLAPVGATIALATPSGPQPFRVAGVYYDYSTDRGVVLMDRATFTRWFGAQRPTSLSIYLRAGSHAEAVRARLLDRLGPSHHAFIHTNASLRAEVLRIFDATFAITYGLEAIAVLVALLGVVGTMLTLVIERREELTTLRFVGADRGQLRRMVMIESGLLGLVGEALGLATGLALSVILIYVINVQSFGWTIQFHVPAAFLLQAGVVLLIVTTLAGAYPATVAARRSARVQE